jgi:hypothetical protein
MEDRRREKRRHLIYYLKVFDVNTDKLIGHLVDITPDGVMLLRKDQIESGLTYDARMLLPDDISGKKEINFTMISRWCKPDINPDYFAIGFQMLNILPEDSIIVQQLVARFGFND